MKELDEEILSFLALLSIKGIGQETLRRFAERGIRYSELMAVASNEDFISLLKSVGARLSSSGNSVWSETREKALARALNIRERLNQIDAKILLRSSSDFPPQLLDLPDAPQWLFVQGDPEILTKPSVAVVGTREPTEGGIWLAKYVGLHLQDWSCPTVSGLALGIDQEVHISSIRSHVPTIAVLGTGIFSDYPRNSEGLRADIVRFGGAIVTEYLPSESYSAKNFVRRNRIQAALAKALIPVEWSFKSGTAHTVRYAIALGRPVACLRLPIGRQPDWWHADFPEKVNRFIVPQQEVEFSQFIEQCLSASGDAEPRQLTLF